MREWNKGTKWPPSGWGTWNLAIQKRARKKVKVKVDPRFKMFITITACHQLLSVLQQTATQILLWLPLTKPPYLTCPPVPLTRPSSPAATMIASLVLLPKWQLCCKSNIKPTIKKVYLLFLRHKETAKRIASCFGHVRIQWWRWWWNQQFWEELLEERGPEQSEFFFTSWS